MDPQLRLLLEVTHEAIVDAGQSQTSLFPLTPCPLHAWLTLHHGCIFLLSGVNPQEIRGSRTGVFIGCSASESHEAWSTDPEKIVGYEMTGCTRSMFANRLSFFFDFKGKPTFQSELNPLL